MFRSNKAKHLASDYVRHRKQLHNDYSNFLNKLCNKENKYYLPVIMGICTYEEVKKLNFEEFHKIYNIAKLKLEKENYELMMTLMYR